MSLPFKSADEVRHTFLAHFLARQHLLAQSSGILPRNDPTLMFINSGMAPMKPYFLGQKEPPGPRLTNVQDCIRFVDIDDVGDSYHGTSFRMMGSWSFGDYFKEQAIVLAFELITEGFGIPVDRLSATVFEADDSLPGVPSDEESARIWEQFLPRDRILPRPPADNFWGPPGTSGPCGPCTEIFFDRGPEFAERETSDPLVPGRHIEIWNAGVFMQYFKDEDGTFSPLPMKCVDTGAGLERFAMILQERASIHEIDQYASVYGDIAAHLQDTRWSRIVLDHLKTAILMLREGVTPSNTREGYLLRRALRRSMMGMHLRGLDLAMLGGWLDQLCEVIDGRDFTMRQHGVIRHWLQAESVSFQALMSRSRKPIDRLVASGALSAEQAFTLRTEVGISDDLLEEICRRHGIPFPRAEYDRLIEEHRAISRQTKK